LLIDKLNDIQELKKKEKPKVKKKRKIRSNSSNLTKSARSNSS